MASSPRMRLGSSAALVGSLAALVLGLGGCGSAPDRERRDLWRGNVAGIDVAIAIELRTEDGGLAAIETITTANARLPAPRYVVDAHDAVLARGDEARVLLAQADVLACPIHAGLAYRIDERPWRVLWVLGGRVFDAAPELVATGCDELHVPELHAWLSRHPGGATTCLALDEDGDRYSAIDCLVVAPRRDLDAVGLPALPGSPDLRAVTRRLADDPASASALVDRFLARPVEPDDEAQLDAVIAVVDAASARDELLRRIRDDCARAERSCDAFRIALAVRAVEGGTEHCELARTIVQALRARPDTDAPELASHVVRAASRCSPAVGDAN